MRCRWTILLTVGLLVGCRSTGTWFPRATSSNDPPRTGSRPSTPPVAADEARFRSTSSGLLDFEPVAPGWSGVSSAVPASSRSAFLAGKIVDHQSRPVPDALVVVTAPGAAGEPTRETATDQRGWFRVDNLLTGQRYLVVVTAFNGADPLIARASIVAPRDRVLITLHPAGQATDEPWSESSAVRPKPWSSETGSHADAPYRFSGTAGAGSGFTRPGTAGAPQPQADRPDSGPPERAEPPRTVTNGVSLRQFIGRLFDRKESEQPALEVPRQQRPSRAPEAGSSGPARPFAELPIPGRPSHRWQSSAGDGRNAEPNGRRLELAEVENPPPGQVVWRASRNSQRALVEPRAPSPQQAVANSGADSAAVARTVVRDAARVPSESTESLRASAALRPAGFWSKQAPEVAQLSLPAADLRPVNLGALEGELLLVDFWASWCGACLRAMPEIERLHREYGRQGLKVVGVAYEQGAVQDQARQLRSVAERLQITYPLLLGSADSSDALRRTFRVRVLPTLVLLDREGNLLWRADGFDPGEFVALRSLVQDRLSGGSAGSLQSTSSLSPGHRLP